SSIMHSLHALALMQEKRIASVGSQLARIQRNPSSTDWPLSNGTAKVCHSPPLRSAPRQILSFAVFFIVPRRGRPSHCVSVQSAHCPAAQSDFFASREESTERLACDDRMF